MLPQLSRRRARTWAAIRAIDRPLAVLAAVALITQVGVAVMLPLLPLYAVALGASPFVLALLTTGFAVANTVGQLGSGFIAERVGARRLIPLGSGIYATGNALIATTGAALPLIAYRAVAGLGAGLSMVAERIYIAVAIPPERLALANGIVSAAGSTGTVLGPAVGGFLAGTDLRVPFILVAITSGVATVLSATLLPAIRAAPRPADPAAMPVAAAEPTVSVEPARSRPWLSPVVALLAANFGLQAAFGGFITTYGPFAKVGLGYSTAEIGAVFAVFGLGDILLGPWLAHLGDRTGRRRMALVAVAPAMVFVAVFAAGLPRPFVYAASIATGGGLTAFGACWYALLATTAPVELRSRVIGVVSAISNLGLVAGAFLASAVWSTDDNLRLAAGTPLVGLALAMLAMLPVPPDRPEPRQQAEPSG